MQLMECLEKENFPTCYRIAMITLVSAPTSVISIS